MIIAGDISDLFVHCAGLGLASILEERTSQSVGIRWIDQSYMEVLPEAELDDDTIAEIVRKHAEIAHESEWLSKDICLGIDAKEEKDRYRSSLSPRVGGLNRANYELLDHERSSLIDSIEAASPEELRFISCLGRPAYWSFKMTKKGVENKHDCGASLWEMSDKRRGDDFVRCRLRRLAETVTKRDVKAVKDGITGTCICDELAGKKIISSTTATGLRGKGETDNAQAWCALWAMSCFPVRPVVSAKKAIHSNTVGTLQAQGAGTFFCLPVFEDLVTLSKIRSILYDTSFYRVTRQIIEQDRTSANQGTGRFSSDSAMEWLKRQKVFGVEMFPRKSIMVGTAVDYWAEPGELHRVDDKRVRR